MAVSLAQALLCLTPTDDADACGQCVECRKVEHRNHPHVAWIEPDGASIKIDQIRDLQKQFGYKASDNRKRIYILLQADRMTIQAANSLLKFLEEPGPDLLAILVTENGQALLPTIQSRAQWIPFVPAKPAELIQQLVEAGIAPELARPAAVLAAGLEGARQLAESESFADARNLMLQLAKEVWKDWPHVLITLQQTLFKGNREPDLPMMADLWALWFKDMVGLRCGRKENLVFIDQLNWMTEYAWRRDTAFWIRGMELALELKKHLRFHANPQLALEKFIIEWQGG